MAYRITKEDVWAGAIEDQPGGLAEKLETVSYTGVNLEFIIARRAPDKPGTGVVFLAPMRGEDATRAAELAGLSKWTTAYSLHIEGQDQPKLAAKITRTIANAGINMRGMSAAKIGGRAVFHLAFDSSSDADKASMVLTNVLSD